MKLLNGYNQKSYEMKWFKNREWLSNLDIDHILNFVSEAKANFYHGGTYAKDFQSVVNGTCLSDKCNLDMLPNEDDGVQYVSFVLNTDVSSGGGIHWFCVFVDLLRKEIYIFDPASTKTNYENRHVDKLLENISTHYDTDFAIFKNKVQKQPPNSGECGIYVVYFILKMIEFSEKYPFQKKCIHDKTKKMWKNKSQIWEEDEKEGSEYFPWFNPLAQTLHQQKCKNTLYCGRPFDIFSTKACYPDITKFNEYMADYIRQTLFCITDNDTCLLPNEKSEYTECKFMDVSNKNDATINQTNYGGRAIKANKLKNVVFKKR